MNIRLLGFLLSIVIFIFLIFQKKIRKWKKALLLLTSFLLAIFTAFLYLFPFKPALKPGGEMSVLTDRVYYSYKSDVSEMLTDENEREIPVKIWYPQDLKENHHPLLIFSPGSFGTVDSNETMFLELASQGYIVMGLSHPYHSFICDMSDGRRIMIDFDFMKSVISSPGSKNVKATIGPLREWTQIRIDDVDYVLSKILDSNTDNIYEKYINNKRIVLSGHSLGGSAALAIGRQRSEDVRALVVLESPFVADIIGIDGNRFVFTDEEYPLPVLHIYSDSLFSKIDEITNYEMNARLIKSDNPMYVNKHIPGVGHIGLTDMVLVSPIITNMIDLGVNTRQPPETLLELNEYVLNFLEEYNG
jgi:predicted alpha/beta hydrolase family esterase